MIEPTSSMSAETDYDDEVKDEDEGGRKEELEDELIEIDVKEGVNVTMSLVGRALSVDLLQDVQTKHLNK